jgi:hypothetical protein
MVLRRTSGVLRRRSGGLASATPRQAASSLTLNEIAAKDRQALQRDLGVTTAFVTFTGSYTGNPVGLEWRLYNPATSAAWTPWTPATSPSFTGSQFSAGALLPSTLEPLEFQVRDATDPSITAACARKFGVGEHVLLIGQSNMAFLSQSTTGKYPTGGKGSYTTAATFSGTTLTSLAYKRLGSYNDALPPGTVWGSPGYPDPPNVESGSTSADGIIHMANYLSTALGCMVTISNYAVTGSKISQWQPGTAGSAYDKALQAMAASGSKPRTIYYLQGEDGELAGYQAALQSMLAGLQNDTGYGANLRFGLVFVGPSAGYNTDPNWMSVIRQAELGFLAANAGTPGVFCGGSAIDANLAGASNIHFDGLSQARQGKRYAKSAAARILGTGDGGSGPKLLSGTRSNVTVTAKFQHALGTLLKDAAGGDGSSVPLQGFRFYDGGASGAQISYTATRITGPDTVDFTLASAPVGALTMDFGLMNAPYGATTALAAVLVDNDTVPGDTYGLPCRPSAAITVTGA